MAFQLGAFQGDAFQIDQIDWMAALSEPPIHLHARPVAQQDHLGYEPFYNYEPSDSMGWHRPLSEPYKKVRDPVADQPFLAYEPFKNNAANDQIDWFRALSEPAKNLAPRRLEEALQQFLAMRWGENFPGDNFDWFRALSEPYLKVRQPVAYQQSYIEPDQEEEINPGAGNEYDWYMALSEPAKFLEAPRLTTALQALYSNPLVKASPFAEQISNRSWVTAIHDETITLTGQMLSGSNIVYVTAAHEESPTLTGQHLANVYMTAVNQIIAAAGHDAAFQLDAFQTNAFQCTQRIIALLTAKVDTNQDDM